MAATLQNTKISCKGGLDLRSTSQDLLQKPGYAEKLQNFEVTDSGGYRRINGYLPFGVNPVPGSGIIKGIYIFNNSILVARGDNIYHTFDASTWVQINKEVTAANLATITAAVAVPMNSSATKVRFAHFSNGTDVEDQMVTMVNGYDEVMYFKVTGTDHNTATYTFTYLDEVTTGAPAGCKYCHAFKDQVYLSGNPDAPSSVYVSTLFDPTSYTGTNSLNISAADPVKGMYPFRENMIIFCESSLFSLQGVAAGSAALVPISENIGCVDGDTIQEINGDLIYLAPDGLRTVAATQRIDDIELSTVSTLIYPLLNEVISNLSQYEFHSTVLREKNQYRLYYPRIGSTNFRNDEGIIGTISYLPEGGVGWAWSTTKGLSAQHVVEGLYGTDYISLMASNNDGILYQHDTSNTFNGDRIPSIFTTPFFDLGDPSVRKNLHRVKTYIKPEGEAEVFLRVQNSGYGNEFSYNPLKYPLGELRIPAVYGEAVYDSNYTYGSRILNTKVINTEGSGFTTSLTYTSSDTGAPYNIQGFDIDFIVSGKV